MNIGESIIEVFPKINILLRSLTAKNLINYSRDVFYMICFFHSILAVQLQLLLYIGIVPISRQCVFAYRQLSFHCRVDVDGI